MTRDRLTVVVVTTVAAEEGRLSWCMAWNPTR